MADQRGGGIAWCDVTWNPTRGCSKVSAGCTSCYAERQAGRFCGPGQPYEGLIHDGRWTRSVRLVPERLADPLRWTKPRRVFVNSMSDLFHERLPSDDLWSVIAVMAAAKDHIFQVLTKRPERMHADLNCSIKHAAGCCQAALLEMGLAGAPNLAPFAWPLRNVWVGVSVEDQTTLDQRVPLLLDTPAAVRWVSLEPLLGPINLRGRPRSDLCIRCGLGADAPHEHPDGYRTHGLDWIVVGGESGPQARPCDVAWVRDILRQCREAGTACFIKQLGSHPVEPPPDWMDTRLPGATHNLYFANRKGADPADWPADLRVREFPA